jgi:hypothetical protein
MDMIAGWMAAPAIHPDVNPAGSPSPVMQTAMTVRHSDG